ncbi:hypothetical protein FT663_00396 [Candidozyma haemuli var. vulneris]|uniref:CRAL-TRIO domain-containing protein n=1 Tax=Candidozyma haemuli TaxID=45357 RepID=A0A2V1AWF6_9ASCO|nr:hypothetical protein CXQ85_000636 [[Candida] haemuloni]KAF3988818.1 hypothetical protein FT662_03196 [[Candida] haemuloni var. vulneris]KAF3995505.1 hypothetical protein FT663_00396 [[Candida] haemuloni var. vulneris]PVH21653.1 hypothetical protein CXQ85_000636 [[Candida] haemuloni]
MYPSVYPSEIQYRPGRIQSLNATQEVALKQCWATLLKSWGYDISLTNDDISLPDSFVSSSIVEKADQPSLAASTTMYSEAGSLGSAPSGSLTLQTTTTASSEKKKKKSKWGLFRSKSSAPKQVSPGRKSALENGYLEKYSFVSKPSDHTRHVYCNHHHLAYDEKKDPLEEEGYDDESTLEKESLSSLETFHTAHSSPDHHRHHHVRPKKSFSLKSVKSSCNVHPAVSKVKPKVVHAGIASMVKNGLLDNMILRFCRARKFNHDDTVQMLVKSVVWKQTEYPAEKWVRESDGPSYFSGENKGFIKNLTTGKSFIRGHDRYGNPLFVFQSRKHFAHDSPLPETERFATVLIEWCRLFSREVHDSVDAFTVIFDLTGFSLKNADNAPIKFLAFMFEAHYPETLGFIIVHNAPWIFSTVWNVIKNWLDPAVVSKIHFTKGYDELVNLIDPEHIPSYLGGDDTDEVPYPVPTAADLRPPKRKDLRYKRLRQQRDELFMRFIDVTRKWCESTDPDMSSRYLRDKILINYQLSDNYIELDPYIRNPGMYDRLGTLVVRN